MKPGKIKTINLTMRLVIAGLFLLDGMPLAFAQDKHDISMAIYGGVNDYHNRDDLYSPLAYSATRVQSVFELTFNKPESIKSLNFSLAYGQVETSTGFQDSDNILSNLQFNYARRLVATHVLGQRLDLYMGSVSEYFLNGNYYNLFSGDGADDVNLSFISTLSTGLNLTARYHIAPRHNVTIQGYAPLLHYLVTLPYAGYDERLMKGIGHPFLILLKYGRLTSLNDYRALSLATDYNFSLSHTIGFTLTHRIRAYTADIPRHSKMFSQDLLLGVHYDF